MLLKVRALFLISQILLRLYVIMQRSDFFTSACRHCRHYVPEGRRGGQCSQLNVPVQGRWKACSLAAPVFEPAWEIERIPTWQQERLEMLQSSMPSLLQDTILQESNVAVTSSS